MPPAERATTDEPQSGIAEFYFDDRSQEIFDFTFEFFGMLDAVGKVRAIRGRIFSRTGIDAQLLVGQLFSETVFWQSSENTARLVEKAVSDAALGRNTSIIVDFRISAEEKIPLELQLLLLRDENSERKIFVSGRALPEKDPVAKQEIESEQLLWAAENAGIGLWYWDIRDARIYSTPSCNELLGLPAYEPITFDSFLTVIHPDDRARVENLFQRLQVGSAKYEEEFRLMRTDGTVDWISAEGRSISNGEQAPTRMMGIVRNVTEQRLATEELARVYDREKRARDEAVEANRAKDFFLAFVSHELRSPLNAILGWAKILLTKTVDDKTRQNALETIERSAKLQTKLINDLVDSARVASGKLRLEFHPTNLCEIVRVAYQSQKPTAEAHNIEFTLKSDCDEVVVFGDAGRLQQVITNLISNAIKFTPDGGKISVDIKLAAETVAIHVKDSGQGISVEALPNIFRQFSQGELGRTRSNTGLGLGLSIVKILVNKHGGAVSALSDGLGKGSEFVVTLPLSQGKPLTREMEDSGRIVSRRPLLEKKILVVEDDADSREVLQLFLEQSGATVESAESAKIAMEFLTRPLNGLPDLIISDLAMPDEDGYSLLMRIRELSPERGGTIPAIALSAFTTTESKQKAFESGFQIYSTKPFEPDRLVADILQLTSSN